MLSPFKYILANIYAFLLILIRRKYWLTTSSPGLKFFTAWPVSTTTPEKSRPKMRGNSLPGFSPVCCILKSLSSFLPYPPATVCSCNFQSVSLRMVDKLSEKCAICVSEMSDTWVLTPHFNINWVYTCCVNLDQ